MSTYDERVSWAIATPFVDQACQTVVAAWPCKLDVTNVESALPAGTYRRQSATIGDVDVIVVTPHLLTEYDWPDWLHVTKKKVSGWMTIGDTRMMLDAWWCPPESVAPMALFLTGPADLNVFMRQVATSKGLLLNQYGLYVADVDEKGKQVPGSRVDRAERVHPQSGELEIMEKLGLEWIAPSDRDSWNETWKRGSSK